MAVDQDILAQLQEQTNLLKKFAGKRPGSGGRSNDFILPLEEAAEAATDLADSLYSGSKSVTATLFGFNEKFTNLNAALTALPFGLGVLGGVIANTVDRYREFLSIGQTFNGSMLEMATAASASSQSIEQLLAASKAAGPALGALGVDAVSDLSDAVRQGSRNFASFGLTMEQTNEYLGDMLETQRQLGILDNLDRHETSQAFNELHIQTTALSKITGKAREEIIKQTLAIQRQTAILTGYLGSLPGDTAKIVQQSVQNAINIFSSLPGEAGETMSRALIDGLSTGSVWMSSTFSEMGVLAAGVVNSLEEVRQTAEQGGDTTRATINTIEELQNVSEEQMRFYAILAATGDQAAQELLKMIQAAKNMNLDELEREKQRAELYGGAETEFLNFQQNMATIFSEIKLAFLQLLSPALKELAGEGGIGLLGVLANKIRDFARSTEFSAWGERIRLAVEDISNGLPLFSDMISYVEEAASALGKWVGLLNEEGKIDFSLLKSTANDMVAIFLRVGAGLLEFADWFTDINNSTYEDMRRRAIKYESRAEEARKMSAASTPINTASIVYNDANAAVAGKTFIDANAAIQQFEKEHGSWFLSPSSLETKRNQAMAAEKAAQEMISAIADDKMVSPTEAEMLVQLQEANMLTKRLVDLIAQQTNVTSEKLQEQLDLAKRNTPPID